MDFDTVLLDVDGTLVDSNYWHTVAWLRAFVKIGEPQTGWKVHTAIGMGGDRLVAAVAGDDVEREHGDAVREIWKRCYDEMLTDVQPFPRAGDLVHALKGRGLNVVLASSGQPDHLEYARKLLNADDAIDAVTHAEDVDSSKPAGDIFEVALKKVGGTKAFVVGDAPWDVQAAGSLPTVSLRSGGFAEETLREAGAAAVYDDPADLLDHLDDALKKIA